MSRWRRLTITMILGALVVAGVGYLIVKTEPPKQQTRASRFRGNTNADRPVPVLATAAKTADVPVYLEGVGTTKALNTVTVRPQVDGKLTDITFKEGQDVKQGDVLARIDPTTYQAQFDQAVAKKAQDEAQLSNARLDLERYQRLAANNAATKQQADTQKAQVAQLEAQVRLDQAAIDNAKAILGYTKITAPISGRTGIRQVDQGNIVHASDATGIVVITQIKPIAVYFNLPQQQLAEINSAFAEGPLPVDVVAADRQKVVEQGRLTVVDNQVDQTTGTVRLKAEFPNANLQLWPGQFVNVRLLINTLHNVVVVPTAAVQRGPNGTFAYTVEPDQKVKMQPITVSQQDDVQSVIAQGLQAGQQVVTTGFAQLADGKSVRVSDGKTPSPAVSSAKPREPGTRRRRQGGGEATSRANGQRHSAGSRRQRPTEQAAETPPKPSPD